MKRSIHRENNWIFPFVAYEPEGMTRKLPLVIQLHGADERGEGGDDLDLVEVWGFPNMAKTGEYPCMFVFPQCPKDTFWAAHVESILKFIEQLVEKFDIDTDRIYLTGLSMGGYGTWYTAMAAPDRFAAIAPVCGGGMAWNAGVLTMPVWAFHGAEDKAVSVFSSDEMVEHMRNCGLNVRYTRLEGVGHNIWLNAYNEDLLNWLLNHKKE